MFNGLEIFKGTSWKFGRKLYFIFVIVTVLTLICFNRNVKFKRTITKKDKCALLHELKLDYFLGVKLHRFIEIYFLQIMIILSQFVDPISNVYS